MFFTTEVLWDTRVVNCQNYSGSTGPVGVEADGEISCFSDGAGREKGSSIYADTPAPTPPPTPTFTSHIVVSDGECDVVGYCVRSPNYPSDYGSNQTCDIRFRSDGTLLVDDFATENSLDYLLLAGDTCSELTDPDDISVTSDSLLFGHQITAQTTRDGCCVLSNVRCRRSAREHCHQSILRSVAYWMVNLCSGPSGISRAIQGLVRGNVRLYGGTHQWDLVGKPRRGRT